MKPYISVPFQLLKMIYKLRVKNALQKLVYQFLG
jgi:hypothetical protein